jgi:DNA-binding response OmpR family regulator
MERRSILIAEDDPTTGRVLEEFLRAHGFATELVRTGEDAVASYRQHPPNLALIDVQLPQLSGFEVFEAIRQQSGPYVCPVLLMSAVYTDRARAEHFERTGIRAEAYLIKPFPLDWMLSTVERFLPARA